MEHHISDSGRKIVRLEEGDYLYSKQNMTGVRMRPRENPILGQYLEQENSDNQWKVGPARRGPERGQFFPEGG
jgi:hypothetical protein